eukprot:gene23887-biopygen16805
MPMVNRIHGQCDHQWGLGRVLRLGTELLGAVLLLSVLLPRQGPGLSEWSPVRTARDLADALKVPLGYLYCDNDHLAEVILLAGGLSDEKLKELATLIKDIDSRKA